MNDHPPDAPILIPGAVSLDAQRTRFTVWAPHRRKVELHLNPPGGRFVPLAKSATGYHSAIVPKTPPGTRYLYRLDGELERPDPASRFQPDGVHGPSAVVDPAFPWTDGQWTGIPLRDYVIYELHVGTFTPAGTFEAVIEHLDELKHLGVNAIELMPVAQFPGTRNWGYDGVHPFAVQNSYGGPTGLKQLVDACHAAGLAVILDVVYNHLGPEGNYLADFAPDYFTDRYRTPWGQALNFDGAHSDHVRHFFLQNALLWQTEFHLDALRLDAIHAICDASAIPFLADLARITSRQAERTGRRFYLIAESDLNDVRIVLPPALSGHGLHAQWSDDFHHALHVLLTGESKGYYHDFDGLHSLARVWREGYAYTGQFSPHRQRAHGNSPRLASTQQFVVCAQNHDQIGNRMRGERLADLVDFNSLKLAAGAVLLSPFLPMLFMGEEYGETAPFLYFTSHSDPALVEAVRAGRKAEFASFSWQGNVPDPQATQSFVQSRLRHARKQRQPHRTLLRFHTELIRLRRSLPALAEVEKDTVEITPIHRAQFLVVHYSHPAGDLLLILAFRDRATTADVPVPTGRWRLLLDSANRAWRGPGSKLPRQLHSKHGMRLTLAGRSLALYQAVEPPGTSIT
jgi:maltooligosyltrehalose trehalohydrolase